MPVDYASPGIGKNINSSEGAGELTLNLFDFDLTASYAPGSVAVASGDRLQIGTIPPGEILVGHLCRLTVPALGVANTIGTTADDNAIVATGPTTAQTLTAEDFTLSTSDVGDPNAAVAVYIKFSAGGTLPSGDILWYQVSRPVDCIFDATEVG